MNRDDALDVVTLSVGSSVSSYKVFVSGDGEDGPEWTGGETVATGLDRGAVLALGDIDEDGAIDLAFTSEGSPRGRVFLNTNACGSRLVARGDANGDGRVDLSDALTVLNHLFLGGALPCPGVSEVNGDDELSISDTLYLLSHLFQGGGALMGESPAPCNAGF